MNGNFLFKQVQSFCFSSLLLLVSDVLQSQMAYPELRNSVKPSPAPIAPGDHFVLPHVTGSPNVNAPIFAEWTRTAGPDESIIVTGVNFSKYTGISQGKVSRFKVYSRSGFEKEAAIQRLDNQKAIVTLDKNMSKWSMYVVWPSNDYGYGYPIAINKTDAWWIGPEKTTREAIASVFGRNLAFNNDTVTSNVYIKKPGIAGQWATVTRVNPYKVDFVVPATLSNGDYEVWVHNGHGGEYGWSGPLKLSVYDNFQWDSTVINVKNYGATGDGATDDLQSIQSAINAASKISGSTVYFPSGTYSVGNTINLASNIRIKGSGNTNTIIKCGSNFSTGASGFVNGTVTNFNLEDISFDTDGNYHGAYLNPVYLAGSSYVTIQNVKFSFQGYDGLGLNQGYRIFLRNCEITGKVTFLGSASQVFIDSCTFRLTNDAEAAIHGWGTVGLSITNSSCQDFDNADPSNGSGWGMGRFYSAEGNFGSGRFTYIGNNTTKDLAVRPDNNVDQNSGEQFMWEGFSSDWYGSVTTSTKSTTTLNGFSSSYEYSYFAVITKGRGLGQSRRIVNYAGSSITLADPWNVIPDRSSTIAICKLVDRTVLYKNFIDGKTYAVTNTSLNASTGIQPFGGTSNFIAANNTIQDVRSGLSNWETQLNAGLDPNFFSFYANNKISNCRWGILNGLNNTKSAGTGILGTTFRNNSISNSLQSGIVYSVISPDTAVLDATLYEHNTFQNVTNGLSTGGDEGQPSWFSSTGTGIENQVLYKNVFKSHSKKSGNYGMKISPKISLRENMFGGFNSLYIGTPNPVIEAPYHVLEISGDAYGNLIDTSFSFYNSGTSVMHWNAFSNAPWLTIMSDSGTITDETATGKINLRINPLNLSIGTHTADVTIREGHTSKTYTVIFNQPHRTATSIYRINSGGDCIKTSKGIFYADAYYSPSPGETYSTTESIAGTVDNMIYQSERNGSEGTLNYAFPVSNGQYTVILHFAEIYYTYINGRVFDVSLEGKKVLDDYDIVKKVGSFTATKESFKVNVTDGILNIDFSSLPADGGHDRPKISAIEILGNTSDRLSASDSTTDMIINESEVSTVLNSTDADVIMDCNKWVQISGTNNNEFSAKEENNKLYAASSTVFKLKATVQPNPSTNYFNLNIIGDSKPIIITIFNATGQLIEMKQNIVAAIDLKLGYNYQPGLYYAVIAQGVDKVVLKMVKQRD